MPYYYAEFNKISGDIYTRINTRIYFIPDKPDPSRGKCLGVFFLKNPGSAIFKHLGVWDELVLKNDKTLPWVANVCAKVIDTNKIERNNYIRIINLITICNPDIDKAMQQFLIHKDCFEKIDFKDVPFIFIGWGKEEELNSQREYYLKKLEKLRSIALFFEYCQQGRKRICTPRRGLPTIGIKVKHPIGLSQAMVIEQLKRVLES